MKMKCIISTDGGVSNGQDPFTSINSTLLLSLEQGLVRTFPERPSFFLPFWKNYRPCIT